MLRDGGHSRRSLRTLGCGAAASVRGQPLAASRRAPGEPAAILPPDGHGESGIDRCCLRGRRGKDDVDMDRSPRPDEEACTALAPCLRGRHPLSRERPICRQVIVSARLSRASAAPRKGVAWPMWSWWAPSGETRGRARSSIGCPSRPISSCVSRAAITPATLSLSTASPTSSRCCPPAWCAAASSRSSATASCSTRMRSSKKSDGSPNKASRSRRKACVLPRTQP